MTKISTKDFLMGVNKELNDNKEVESTQFLEDSTQELENNNEEEVIVRKVVEVKDELEDNIEIVEETEQISDVEKVVKAGKVVKKTAQQVANKKKAKGGLSPAEYKARIANLKKARKKAWTPEASKKRAKSLAIRKKKVSDDVNDGVEQISDSKLNLEAIGDTLRELVQDYIMKNYEVSDEALDLFAEVLVNDNFVCKIDDGKLHVTIPVWNASDELDAEEHTTKELVFELEDGLDQDSIISGIVEDFDILTEVFSLTE